jgi:hypothetical protein
MTVGSGGGSEHVSTAPSPTPSDARVAPWSTASPPVATRKRHKKMSEKETKKRFKGNVKVEMQHRSS